MSRKGLSLRGALILGALLASLGAQARAAGLQEEAPWTQRAELPDPVGVAGPVVGPVRAGLLAAGGANFPGVAPWDGGAKVYHDRVHLLPEPGGTWRTLEERLPAPVAYPVTVSTPRGLIVVGGHDADRVHDEVLRLDLVDGRLVVEELPPLPHPLTHAGGGLVGSQLIVVGGQTEAAGSPGNSVLVLDLALEGTDAFGWEERAPMPGPRRGLPVVCRLGEELLVASGRDYGPARAEGEPPFAFHADLLRYDPRADRWTEPAALALDGRPLCVMAGAAVPVGEDRAWLLGGASGEVLQQLVDLEAAGDEEARLELLRSHPGFSSAVLEVGPTADVREVAAARAAQPLPVTTQAVLWRGEAWLVSGEVRPGVRTAGVMSLFLPGRAGFGAANWVTLGLYLLGMVGIGWACSRRVHGAEDFFLAGRRIPWWAAGLSIFGTQLSAITFMAIPATAYGDDWSRMVGNLTLLVVLPIAALVFVPLFCRAGVSTAYQLLGQRFGTGVQRLGASLFVLVQLGRMGIVLFLPAIALATVTGIPVEACILLMGLLCILYTVMGGFEAVVWTDVAQVVVLLGGALLALWVAVSGSGGLEEALATASDAGRLRLAKPGWGLDQKTLPTMVLGTLVLNLIPYASDQTVVQRYLATPDERAARKGLWVNVALTVPAALLFYGLGAALFAFYKGHPEAALPASSDHLVPWFVVQQLPAGVAGFVVAAVFAASMSSLDSSMNSVATVLHHDFGLGRGKDALVFGRRATVVLGVLGTAAALAVAWADVKFLFDLFNRLLGFFGGALAGVFVLAVVRPRTSPFGAGAGLVAGAASAALASFLLVDAEPRVLDGYLLGAIGLGVAVVLGMLAPARGGSAAGS